LPRDGYATEVRLIADFIVDVVEFAQLFDDAPRHSFLNRKQSAVPVERVDVGARNVTETVDIVRRIERTELPLRFFVHRTEQIHLDDDAALAGMTDKIAETLKVVFVPTREIELVAAARVTRNVTARPGSDIAVGCRGERVARNVECALRLNIRDARLRNLVLTL